VSRLAPSRSVQLQCGVDGNAGLGGRKPDFFVFPPFRLARSFQWRIIEYVNTSYDRTSLRFDNVFPEQEQMLCPLCAFHK